MYFHPDSEERGKGAEGNRAMKKLYVEPLASRNAVLVIDGDEAVASAEYGTPAGCRTSTIASSTSPRPTSSPTTGHLHLRRQAVPRAGLAKMALAGAVDLIAAQGGGVVEGYPHEIGEKRMTNSFVYNGTRAMYEQGGFEFVRSKGLKNTVMRRTVAPTA